MFQGIKNTLDKKKKSLTSRDSNQNNIQNIFNEFVDSSFPKSKDLMSFELDYDLNSRRLIIKSNNKSVASEIALRVGDLNKILKREGVFLTNIVIN